jgi:hypothetical protein
MYKLFAKSMLPRICKDFYEMEITTAVPVDDQFSPKQIRCCPPGSPLAGKLLVCGSSTSLHERNADLSLYTKFNEAGSMVGVDSDILKMYIARTDTIWSYNLLTPLSGILYIIFNSIRMVDASGDSLHVYVTSNNATDGHGIRMITKSSMALTLVGGNPVQILSTGTTDGKFTNPLGVLYIATNADSGFLYVCEATRICKIAVVTTAGSESFTWTTSYAIAANDLAWDGTNFYTQSNTQTIKYDNVFTDATKVAANRVGYSICLIPNQGDGADGVAPTLGIVDSTNSHLERVKTSDLTTINSVGSAGDGSSSLFDPKVTGVAGTWQGDDGESHSVASGADISKNGFSGDFFQSTGHKMTFKPSSGKLSDITAIDANTDGIIGEIKNLHKCVNLTSLKLQTNPGLILNLSQQSAKLVTLWAYGCGARIFGSIRHMTALSAVNLRENGVSSVQVDQWIGDLYANKDIMAPGTANFNGTNLAPSAEAKAQADELIATYGWTVAYTA